MIFLLQCLAFCVMLVVHAGSATAQELTGEVCSHNSYALCSSARCECLDHDGNPGACETYTGTDRGWAKCDCPIVLPVGRDARGAAYNANFGELACDERAVPSNTGLFPTYVDQAVASVYSEYSFGDSLASNSFGTKDSASLMVCDSPSLMTLCLDMPCTIDNETGNAICYCQNVSVKTTDGNLPWNTLGGDCEQDNCRLKTGMIWSAALVPQTVQAIMAIAQYQMTEIQTSDIPRYCQVPD